ncbi:hypothetical protein HMPREF0183_0418 [Brevibacterium mcbrellneri ATCC 49030]|uniref:DUF3099 domain-containing protein n=1 Tax=Brevibacterium mcbrellneri ATCC 49030 TaxID=585530 RepID=D4YKF8_9MICO|nr:DUF3099 domain-containing protein [Brevibacterium mcbrellneri]EFG48296.1 hypothetical protein HMPREF0183_0418 [Brevibacterium mcbrellneri ATCC 49030]
MSKEQTVRVTDAQHSHEAESNGRMRQYTVLMAIRLTCFFVAALTSGWVRWTAAAGAIVLPWVAVTIANTVRRHFYTDKDEIAGAPTPQALDDEPAEDVEDEEPDVVIGEVVGVLESPRESQRSRDEETDA